MNAAASKLDHYRSEFRALAQHLPGKRVPWVQRTRQRAFERFAELGFPTPRNEDWKYTRVAPIEKRAFRAQGKTCIGLTPDDLDMFDFSGLACHRLVFINGQYAPQLSERGRLPEGVVVGSLSKTLLDNPTVLESHLGHYADAGANGFTALNTAFMDDGAYIHVAKDTVVTAPIHLLFVSTTKDDDVFTHPRILVVADESSQAAVVESYVSLGGSGYLNNAVTEVVLGANAHVDHYKLQQESEKAFHIATLQIHHDRDSRFTSHSISLGGLLVRNDINAVLDAEGADCTLNGLYMVDGRQHVDYHTRVDHAKPLGTSREFYKGILSGRSRGVFNGRIYVHPDAQKTDAQQSNDNLLLSRDAEVDTKPQLEIYADDVKCAHGATVGQLDEEMIFYLRSRGIECDAARGLLTYGFAREVVDKMGIIAIRAKLEKLLLGEVPFTAQVRGMVQ